MTNYLNRTKTFTTSCLRAAVSGSVTYSSMNMSLVFEPLLVEIVGDRLVGVVERVVGAAVDEFEGLPSGDLPTAISPRGGDFGGSAIGMAAWNWNPVSSVDEENGRQRPVGLDALLSRRLERLEDAW